MMSKRGIKPEFGMFLMLDQLSLADGEVFWAYWLLNIGRLSGAHCPLSYASCFLSNTHLKSHITSSPTCTR